MSLKTYDRPRGHNGDGDYGPWPFKHLYADQDKDFFQPGDWVFHTTWEGVGLVVAITEDQMSVLWSQEPKGGFSNIAFPTVRRVYPQAIANEIVSVQPMSMPKGLIFYMDYTYGDKWDKRCTTGPMPVRVFWRACRWLKTRITSTGSSLRSWWRSRSGKKLSSGVEEAESLTKKWAASQVTPDQTKAIVDAWVNRNAAKARGPGIQGR